MNSDELDQLLRQMLADHKLSGSEKTLLTGWAMKHLDSDADRGLARKQAFEVVREHFNDDTSRRVLVWLEEVLKVIAPVQNSPAIAPIQEDQAFFSPGDACLRQIVHRFNSARKAVDVCVFTITDDRITRSLLDAHRRGVTIRLITDNDKALDEGSDIEDIAAAGVPVKVDRTPYHMHHKFAIFDGSRLLNGSYNWTRNAAELNEENLVECCSAKLLAAFQKEFNTLWEKL